METSSSFALFSGDENIPKRHRNLNTKWTNDELVRINFLCILWSSASAFIIFGDTIYVFIYWRIIAQSTAQGRLRAFSATRVSARMHHCLHGNSLDLSQRAVYVSVLSLSFSLRRTRSHTHTHTHWHGSFPLLKQDRKQAGGFLMSPPCLESQGCQFDPIFLCISLLLFFC